MQTMLAHGRSAKMVAYGINSLMKFLGMLVSTSMQGVSKQQKSGLLSMYIMVYTLIFWQLTKQLERFCFSQIPPPSKDSIS